MLIHTKNISQRVVTENEYEYFMLVDFKIIISLACERSYYFKELNRFSSVMWDIKRNLKYTEFANLSICTKIGLLHSDSMFIMKYQVLPIQCIPMYGILTKQQKFIRKLAWVTYSFLLRFGTGIILKFNVIHAFDF